MKLDLPKMIYHGNILRNYGVTGHTARQGF